MVSPVRKSYKKYDGLSSGELCISPWILRNRHVCGQLFFNWFVIAVQRSLEDEYLSDQKSYFHFIRYTSAIGCIQFVDCWN